MHVFLVHVNITDWEIVSHHGWFPGLYSMITLLPSRNIGIYTAINGGRQLLPHTILSLLHTYLLDILLDVETPWLNRTTACSFPGEDIQLKDMQTKEATLKTFIASLNVAMEERDVKYIGCYWSSLYAGITVNISANNNSSDVDYLEMRLGRITMALRPIGDDHFYAVPISDHWLIRPMQVTFVTSNGYVSSLQLPPSVVRANFDRVSDIKCTSNYSSLTYCFDKSVLAILLCILTISKLF